MKLQRRLWRLFQYLDTAGWGLESEALRPGWQLFQGEGKLSVFDLKIFYLALLQALASADCSAMRTKESTATVSFGRGVEFG